MSLTKWFKEDWVDIGAPKKVAAIKNVVGLKPKVLNAAILNAYQLQRLLA